MKTTFLSARVRILTLLFLVGAIVFAGSLSKNFSSSAQKLEKGEGDLAPEAGTYSGRVFKDYNGNGVYDTAGGATNPAVDVGVGGVTVTLYNAVGAASGTANTASDGIFSITSTGTGPYRVEYTNLPTGFLPSVRSTDSVGAGTTTNAGSTVQFVNNGGVSNLNLAINVPNDYCQSNPLLCTAIFRPGNQSGTRSTSVAVPYNSPTVNSNLANESQTGTVYGTAYHRLSRTIFQAAYMKRHSGFGPLGTGGIYKIAMSSGSPVFAPYVDLQTIGLSTGTDPRVTAGYVLPATGSTPHWDHAAYTEVGKRAIGDLDYDEGRNILWFINLNDRRLHGIRNVNPNVTPVNADLVRDPSNNLGFSVNTSTPVTCTNGVLRPFGIKVHRGLVYVGAVCTGENAGAVAANLIAYVFSMNPSNPSAGFTEVLNFPLNYTRTASSFGGGSDTPWQPWQTSDSNRAIGGDDLSQPIVSDLEFDNDGSLIMAVKDRWGDQYAASQYRPDTAQSNTTLISEIYAFGDTLRFCSNGTAFVNPGATGCANNARPGGETAGSSQGPGGGEFYVGDWGPDSPNSFRETSHGALAFFPGSPEVVSTSLDPNNYYSNGLKWLSNTSGDRTRAYNVFVGSSMNTTNDFNKGNGLGDVELLCDSAPIEVGNRLWIDTDNDGVQDPTESVAPNVPVQLWADTDTNGTVDAQVGATTSNSNGHYIFGGASNANMLTYTCGTTTGTADVRVNASSDDAEQQTTGGTVVLNGTDLDFFGETNGGGTAYSNLGVRFNGLNIPQGATITSASIEFTANNSTTVSAGTPAITIQGENADNAATFTVAANNISGRTWLSGQDVLWNPGGWTQNSTTNASTPSLVNIVQSIVNRGAWASGNSMAFRFTGTSTAAIYREAESWDDNPAAAPRLVVTYTANATCNRRVEPNTAYQVRIPSSAFNIGQPLGGYVYTRNDVDSGPNSDARDSDGTFSGGHVVKNFTTGGSGDNNHTYDFGFLLAPTAANVSVEGRVLLSAGNGIRNATVVLTEADGTQHVTRTGSFGFYRFTDIEAGQAVVVSISSKRFVFNPSSRVVNVTDNIADLDFIAQE